MTSVPTEKGEPMSDYIKRDDVIEALKLLADEDDPFDEGYNLGLNTAIIEVKKHIPTAEPKVGKWIDTNMTCYGAKVYKCSVCDNEIDEMPTEMGEPIWNYCPNCGAKMEESR